MRKDTRFDILRDHLEHVDVDTLHSEAFPAVVQELVDSPRGLKRLFLFILLLENLFGRKSSNDHTQAGTLWATNIFGS